MSFQSQFIYFMMKNRHLLWGRLKSETRDENTSIAAFRESAEAGKFPEATQALEEVCGFIKQRLGKA